MTKRLIESQFDSPKPIDTLLSIFDQVKITLNKHKISYLIGGGIAVDLAALKHLPNHTLRLHGDIELLIPITQRGYFINILDECGFKSDPSIFNQDIHFMTLRKNGIKFEIFFTYGNETHTYTPFIFTGKRMLDASCVEISSVGEEVIFNNKKYKILDPKSSLKIKENIDDHRDKKTLESILGQIN